MGRKQHSHILLGYTLIPFLHNKPMFNSSFIHRILPFTSWASNYNRTLLSHDSTAALIVSIMLIPQALAYGLLAGLPPQTGLYASLLPLVMYALFGRSAPLSVGPFAITSIMTAAALSSLFPTAADPQQMLVAGALMALCSGILLISFGLLRLGFLSNFISFPVVTGFISASALVIASSQISNLFGIPKSESGHFFQSIWFSIQHISTFNPYTTALGLSMLLLLKFLPPQLKKVVLALSQRTLLADIISKATPLFAMLFSILISLLLDFEQQGVALVGTIPQGFPHIALPHLDSLNWSDDTWQKLLTSAALISLIGFVSSLSAAQAFAAKQRQRIAPNQEAIALGVANLSAGVSGAFPVAASLSRSAVSFQAGAKTPATSLFTAISIALSCLFLTPYLYHLPLATLTAMIIVAVLSLFDGAGIKRTWHYSRQDFTALFVTMTLTLLQGVEWGLVSGILVSIVLYLYRSSQPHTAVLGQIPNTEHFRNIQRHKTLTDRKIISLRIDASLYFANARFLEDKINQLIAHAPDAQHLILNCSAINSIDSSALESLLIINDYLDAAGIQFHLSEVKGPVMDKLNKSKLTQNLTGNIYLSHYQAWTALKAAIN